MPAIIAAARRPIHSRRGLGGRGDRLELAKIGKCVKGSIVYADGSQRRRQFPLGLVLVVCVRVSALPVKGGSNTFLRAQRKTPRSASPKCVYADGFLLTRARLVRGAP